MAKVFNKFLDFIGVADNDEDDEEEFYEEEEAPVRRATKGRAAAREEEEDEFLPDPPAPKATASVPQASAKRTTTQSSRVQASPNAGVAGAAGMKMIVYHPVSYEDTQNIVDNIRSHKPVIVNMEELEMEVAQRILDFISGATYALNASLNKISRGIFVIAPSDMSVLGDDEQEYGEI